MEEPPAVDEAAAPEGETEAEATTEAEAGAAEAAGTEQAAGEETEPPAEEAKVVKRSFLSWLVEASGIFGVVLLLLSFIMVALITMNLLQVRRSVLLPTEFIDAFEDKLKAKDYQGAYEIARNDDSFVARVLAAGLSKLGRGYEEAIAGMQEVGEDENMALEHRLSYLALIGSIAPMIGLLGTVYGMIMSFEEIATSPTQPKPSELAAGISTALFTTLEGLTVAIPAMVAYSILRNRVARFVLEVGMVSEGLMSRFATTSKPKAAAKAASATATTVTATPVQDA
ncbi:MAG: MotA/TolQ/ExbB proton channel family protein [Planctomycetes bacterium]|nr:MotA/TolQ/ExbB proton channel family protein [Planctomycetota bacterium]